MNTIHGVLNLMSVVVVVFVSDHESLTHGNAQLENQGLHVRQKIGLVEQPVASA
jgi:hypothetical protein